MMNNVTDIKKAEGDIEYIFDEGVVIGVRHSSWKFRIMRNGGKVAFVCDETEQPFGELDGKGFNSTLLAWLLIDEPSIADKLADKE
tara:strand:- start:297 stop:554 length:258 start_codon:yes stop_codon:yes gene_type:complete